MDTFFEQIISIKKSPAKILGVVGIWFLALLITVFFLLFKIPYIGALSPLIIFGALFGAFKLTTRFNVEYEYIITNGILDIDKIINKSSRKRYLSLDLTSTSRIEKFNPGLINNVDKKSVTIACDVDDPNAYLIVVDKESGGASYLVMSPNEKIKGAIIKSVPKFISNSAFK